MEQGIGREEGFPWNQLVPEVEAEEFICHAASLKFCSWPFVVCLMLMLAPGSWTA